MNLKCVVRKNATMLKNKKLVENQFLYKADEIMNTAPVENGKNVPMNRRDKKMSEENFYVFSSLSKIKL